MAADNTVVRPTPESSSSRSLINQKLGRGGIAGSNVTRFSDVERDAKPEVGRKVLNWTNQIWLRAVSIELRVCDVRHMGPG